LGEVTPGDPAGNRLTSLVEELKKEGLVEAAATTRKRKIPENDKGALKQGGLLMKEVLVFTKTSG
jgi:hypothetical protein